VWPRFLNHLDKVTSTALLVKKSCNFRNEEIIYLWIFCNLLQTCPVFRFSTSIQKVWTLPLPARPTKKAPNVENTSAPYAAMSTTTEVLSSGHAILEEHAQLMETIKTNHNKRRELFGSLPSSLTSGITFPELPKRTDSSLSNRSDPLGSPHSDAHEEIDPYLEHQRKQLQRTDLSPEKLAKVRRYVNYVPEEETIRNDYSQQYVNSGEWPQNWVLGAELEKRFEEYVTPFTNSLFRISP
jgi:hypothetical protein